ncbi:serine/threonine-protein kinase [Muricoccus radiodurans]|uniref:serine/threonine-protein kinase n=1 Tax=Muricoccus radiodurans TaxID=2231721 RepID=UPI003CE813C3
MVIEGLDRVIRRNVAIKVVRKPALDDAEAMEILARFRQEPVTSGGLSHPGIAAIYDYGEDERYAWMVMEMVSGGTLDSLLKKGDRLLLSSTVRIIVEVLRALSHAHARGVVHRDIKPSNIMLADDGQPKLVDFGVARATNSDLTIQGTLMGTPSYMSPEQFRGEAVDARADLWACGVLLYQMLTGRKPFEGEPAALLHQVISTVPPLPSDLRNDIPPAVDAVVMRALSKSPHDRWPDAISFIDALTLAAKVDVTASTREELLNREARPKRRLGWLIAVSGLSVVISGALALHLFQPFRKPDVRAIANAVLAAAPCGLLTAQIEESSFSIEGVLPQTEAERARAVLADSTLPPGVGRVHLDVFEGPFCSMFSALRPALAQQDERLDLTVVGAMPLRHDQLLRLDVVMPAWANYIHVAYASSDGSLVLLEEGSPQAPGTRVRLGEPRPDFPGWAIDRPFGTDLVLLVVSDGPFLPVRGQQGHTQAEYAENFTQAFRVARDAGRRVALRPAVVETAPKE